MRNNESYLHTKISGWVTKLTFDIQALFLVIAIYTHISVSGVVFWRINGWLDSSSSRAKSFTRSYSENMYKSISEIGFHIVLWSYDVQTFQKIIIAWDFDDCWKCQSIMERILLLDATFKETDLLIQTCWLVVVTLVPNRQC